MRVLWVCNIMLPAIAQSLHRECSHKEGWLTGLFDALCEGAPELELGVAFPVSPAEELLKGSINTVRYYGFRENTGKPEEYDPAVEQDLREILQDFKPDLLHCFGAEFPHTLAALRVYGRPDRSIIHIQGLCTLCAEAYMANLPENVQTSVTFRDWLRRDSLLQQQKKFRLRGQHEQEAVKLTGHVTGRTDWDRQWTMRWNPDVAYHLLNETLRPCFYQGKWQYENCRRHTLFMSQGDYPLKGLHYMLDAMPAILDRYPDAHLYVAGNSLLRSGLLGHLKISGYGRYLGEQIKRLGLSAHVIFLGSLTGEQMKQQYLECNACVCVSSVENSPNSIGEAMLLEVPVVAGKVGGIPTLITEEEGWLFPGFCGEGDGQAKRISGELARSVLEVFDLENRVQERTEKAVVHARRTHDRSGNLQQLIGLYGELIEA